MPAPSRSGKPADQLERWEFRRDLHQQHRRDAQPIHAELQRRDLVAEHNGESSTRFLFYVVNAPGSSPALPTGTSGSTGVSALNYAGQRVRAARWTDPRIRRISAPPTIASVWPSGDTLTIYWTSATSGTSDGLGVSNVVFSAVHANQLPPKHQSTLRAPTPRLATNGSFQLAETARRAPTWALSGSSAAELGDRQLHHRE